MFTNGKNGYDSLSSTNYYEDVQGVLAATLQGNEADIDGVQFSSNGKYLVSSSAGKSVDRQKVEYPLHAIQ